MRVEDIGVEETRRVGDHRAGDPGDIPDAEEPVLRVDASSVAKLKRQRIGQRHRRDDGQCCDEGRFTTEGHTAAIVAPYSARFRTRRAATWTDWHARGRRGATRTSPFTSLLDRNQRDVEDQRGVRWNQSASCGAVGELGGYNEAALAAFTHSDQALFPTRYDSPSS